MTESASCHNYVNEKLVLAGKIRPVTRHWANHRPSSMRDIGHGFSLSMELKLTESSLNRSKIHIGERTTDKGVQVGVFLLKIRCYF